MNSYPDAFNASHARIDVGEARPHDLPTRRPDTLDEPDRPSGRDARRLHHLLPHARDVLDVADAGTSRSASSSRTPRSSIAWAERYRRTAPVGRLVGRRAKSTNEPREPEIHPPQLPGPGRDREGQKRKDFSEVDRLRGVLRLPFDEQPEMEHYAQPAPEWGRHLQVSCSS